MSEPLDELYLTWLYGQVASVKAKNRARTYWSLLKQLYNKEFVWIVPNDDNRVEDGKDLRYEYLDTQEDTTEVREWLSLGCSVLEMLVGLSRRLSFEAEGEPRYWFWLLIENLDLDGFTDNVQFPPEEVDAILDQLIYRTYSVDGVGGLFPLKHPVKDQRLVEIWYQASAYLLEFE